MTQMITVMAVSCCFIPSAHKRTLETLVIGHLQITYQSDVDAIFSHIDSIACVLSISDVNAIFSDVDDMSYRGLC